MAGPHRATAPGAAGPAASRQGAVRKFGARRGLGRIFGLSEGRAVYAAAGRPSPMEGLNGGAYWTKPRKREREVGKEGAVTGKAPGKKPAAPGGGRGGSRSIFARSLKL